MTSFIVATGSAFVLYAYSLAQGLTWAHHGADGGELIAAAVTNGVPHPPGYPLYTLLLRGWLGLLGIIAPTTELAWRGNLFSALLAALSVGVTVVVALRIFRNRPLAWIWALLAGLAWTISSLPWSQAVITEVYALHMLAMTLLAWAVLVHPGTPILLIPIVALGMANHLTFALLLPAALYYDWTMLAGTRSFRHVLLAMTLGLLLGMSLYLRIPLLAMGNGGPPPINWGYADNWQGFLWLISGSAYRGYLFDGPMQSIVSRLATWANTLATQLTPVGLGLALWGLAYWDEAWPKGRSFALLWILPISVYSLAYYTRDNEIYLLPVVWMLALLFATGVFALAEWVEIKVSIPSTAYLIGGAALSGLIVLAIVRAPEIMSHTTDEAEIFLAGAKSEIEPGSIVVTNEDTATFALWYGNWGSGELQESASDMVLINYALYQFEWYRRLLGELYPHVPGVDLSVEAFLAANIDKRPVFFSEILPIVPEDQLIPAGPLWRHQ
jgi:hypothetical protein